MTRSRLDKNITHGSVPITNILNKDFKQSSNSYKGKFKIIYILVIHWSVRSCSRKGGDWVKNVDGGTGEGVIVILASYKLTGM